MDKSVAEHVVACRDLIIEFGNAIINKNQSKAFAKYAEFGYRMHSLKGKSSNRLENVLETVFQIEYMLLGILGEYISLEQEELSPGDLRLVYFENQLAEHTDLLIHRYLPIYSRGIDIEISERV